VEIFDILTYDYRVEVDVDIVDDIPAYTRVNELETMYREAGLYEVRLGIIWSLNTTNKSGIARFSVDGGVSWQEVWSEPKDKTNDNASDFTRTINHTGGPIHVILDMARESGTAAMKCKYSEIAIKRVG
jgi:hypothetical protein